MNRDEQEMALWREAYTLAMSQDADPVDASGLADAAVAEFRRRYPPQPVAPEAVWYDEPPFPKDGKERPCWIMSRVVGEVYWSGCEWRMCVAGDGNWHRLNGRRVCPIAKPQEPKQ